jgi:RNA polymerase sigma factor (sigma-70 family)
MHYYHEWPDCFTPEEIGHIATVARKRMPPNLVDREDFWQVIRLRCWREARRMEEEGEPIEGRLARLRSAAIFASQDYWRNERVALPRTVDADGTVHEVVLRRECTRHPDEGDYFWAEVPSAMEEPNVEDDGLIRELLRDLSEGESRVFGLRFFSGLPFGQIADHLGKGCSTVKTQWSRAVDKLRKINPEADPSSFLEDLGEEAKSFPKKRYFGPVVVDRQPRHK